MLMISAGMPELKNKEELEYLREMLSLKLTQMEADGKFIAEIQNSLDNRFRRYDNLIHIWKHAKKEKKEQKVKNIKKLSI